MKAGMVHTTPRPPPCPSPIEIVWAEARRRVARKKETLAVAPVEKLVKESLIRYLTAVLGCLSRAQILLEKVYVREIANDKISEAVIKTKKHRRNLGLQVGKMSLQYFFL
jgi:hypothetical protein